MLLPFRRSQLHKSTDGPGPASAAAGSFRATATISGRSGRSPPIGDASRRHAIMDAQGPRSELDGSQLRSPRRMSDRRRDLFRSIALWYAVLGVTLWRASCLKSAPRRG